MTEETREEVWKAEQGCVLEDRKRPLLMDYRGQSFMQGVVVESTKKWFRILWDSGREERVYRDYRQAGRHYQLRAVPKR